MVVNIPGYDLTGGNIVHEYTLRSPKGWYFTSMQEFQPLSLSMDPNTKTDSTPHRHVLVLYKQSKAIPTTMMTDAANNFRVTMWAITNECQPMGIAFVRWDVWTTPAYTYIANTI